MSIKTNAIQANKNNTLLLFTAYRTIAMWLNATILKQQIKKSGNKVVENEG